MVVHDAFGHDRNIRLMMTAFLKVFLIRMVLWACSYELEKQCEQKHNHLTKRPHGYRNY